MVLIKWDVGYRRSNTQNDRQTDGRTDRNIGVRTHKMTNKQTNRRTDRNISVRTHKMTNKQTDKQTDGQTYKSILI